MKRMNRISQRGPRGVQWNGRPTAGFAVIVRMGFTHDRAILVGAIMRRELERGTRRRVEAEQRGSSH